MIFERIKDYFRADVLDEKLKAEQVKKQVDDLNLFVDELCGKLDRTECKRSDCVDGHFSIQKRISNGRRLTELYNGYLVECLR